MSGWRAAAGEKSLRVRVAYPAGVLTIRRGPAGGLWEAQLRFDEDAERPQMEYESERLRVGTANREGASRGRRRQGELDLALSPRVPVALDVQFGYGRAELDLTGMRVERLDLSTGASEAVVRAAQPNPVQMDVANFQVGAADLSVVGLGNLNAKHISAEVGVGAVKLDLHGSWEAESRLSVEIGIGLLALRVPESLGVRLRLDAPRLPGALDLDRMARRDDAYYSRNWDNAERTLDIDIKAGLGSIQLEWVP